MRFRLSSEDPPEETVAVCWRLIHEIPDPEGIGGAMVAVEQSSDGGLYRVTYLDGHRYYLSLNGERVWACPPSAAHPADTVAYLLGPILGLLLRLRGKVVLHASAVAVGSRALVVLGPSGAGKSTLAASLVSLGHRLVTDDLLPLTADARSVYGEPGYGRIRLWADSARSLAPDNTDLPRVSPAWDKKYIDPGAMGSGLVEQPIPISAIYLLREREAGLDSVVTEPISPREAVVQLLANTFAAPLVPPDMRRNELLTLGRVAETLPMRAITIPDLLSTHKENSRRLLRDFSEIA